MSSHLHQIQNWIDLAKQTKWSASTLARRCGVSMRTLERHFIKYLGKSPKAWLGAQRQLVAIELLRNGRTVKETADHIGYEHASTFSREIKKHWGNSPIANSGPPKKAKPEYVA